MTYLRRKKRRRRADVSSFAALVAAPVVGSVTLPANARLGFRRPSGIVAAGTLIATLTGPTTREIRAPALAANEIHVLDYTERGTVVTPAFSFDVLIDSGLGVWRKIAEGEL